MGQLRAAARILACRARGPWLWGRLDDDSRPILELGISVLLAISLSAPDRQTVEGNGRWQWQWILFSFYLPGHRELTHPGVAIDTDKWQFLLSAKRWRKSGEKFQHSSSFVNS